jgi:ankyrin repeat protein
MFSLSKSFIFFAIVLLSSTQIIFFAGAADVETAATETTPAEVTTQEEPRRPSKLLESVNSGDIDGINLALEQGEEIDLVNDNGFSAAMFAVVNGDLAVLQFLIERGIDLNNGDVNGVTPLMLAASQVIPNDK